MTLYNDPIFNNLILQVYTSWKATIMDKSSRDTPQKRPASFNAEFFNLQFWHFDRLSPFQCCTCTSNHVKVSTERMVTLKKGGGVGVGWLSTKTCYRRMLINRNRPSDRVCGCGTAQFGQTCTITHNLRIFVKSHTIRKCVLEITINTYFYWVSKLQEYS